MSHTRSISTVFYKFLKTNLTTNSSTIKHIHSSRLLEKNVAFNLSDIGEGIREVIVKEWYVKEGDKVVQFDNICEVQSDKASVTITSRYDGTITKLHHNIDDVALVGKPLVNIETDEAEDTGAVEKKSTLETPKLETIKSSTEIKKDINNLVETEFIHTNCDIICIPSVRRLAKENNLNLSLIKGTGKHGRILKEDVLKYLENNNGETSHSGSLVDEKQDLEEAISGFQRIMVKTMTESLKIPHFVYSDEITVTKLSDLRQSLKAISELNETKISLMPFFIKAASNALKKYPIINATTDQNLEKIYYKKNHNIGIAMDTKAGLAVPVIKNVENLGILDIARELNRLVKSGKNGSFAPSDIRGGTFSISNIGSIGGTYMMPVITPPQLAIIALGTTKVLPRFDKDMKVVPESIINISASADHRFIDGATMANFIEMFKRQIENPNLLFLNV
ncbi:unnamed protein product [Brassicogethes aeneus]|uniref:Dihydrolipoamide acetyltransferase component of pyruvate dehydrogenase complex n=1 Tax=Brassicogethes aeneus TaxID=1431903 RepID=A0A9P0BFF2_BRAAE|nr:unnamed protein product [Brassicogethes aeneus]